MDREVLFLAVLIITYATAMTTDEATVMAYLTFDSLGYYFGYGTDSST
jgi:hypothetical protein